MNHPTPHKRPSTFGHHRLLSLTAIIIVSTLFTACDPDDPPGPDPSVGDLPSGVLTVHRVVHTMTGGVIDTSDNIEAQFAATPGGSALVDAGTVTHNNDTLFPDPTTWIYDALYPDEPLSATAPSIWNVSGSAAIPAFSYTHNASIPQLTDTLPMFASKAAGITFTFPTLVTGADSFAFFLSDGLHTINKKAAVASGSLHITSTELMPFANNAYTYQVTASNRANEVLGGKRYWFYKSLLVDQYLLLLD